VKVDIYESIEKHGRYFVVPSSSATPILPEKFNPTKKKSIEIKEGENRIGLSGTETITDIKKNGYHVTNIAIKFNEST